jgi:choloylglycine hydrolase
MVSTSAFPCTGITLKSNDGGVVVSRTVEWALNDAQHNKILVVPRHKQFVGQTPEGYNGMKWKGKYGFVADTLGTTSKLGNPRSVSDFKIK